MILEWKRRREEFPEDGLAAVDFINFAAGYSDRPNTERIIPDANPVRYINIGGGIS